MGLPMEKCSICGRDIPKHVMPKHMAKWHSGEVETKVETKKEEVTSTPEPEISVTGVTDVTDVIDATDEKEPWYVRWDAGEITTCSQCHTEWPSKLMAFHLRFEHGL